MSGIYALKPWFVRRLRSVEDVFVERRVRPNAITVGAILVSVAAGAAIAGGAALDRPVLWLAVLPLGVIRLALNALDGSVARRRQMSTGRGAAFNELGDRACDLAMFVPLISIGPVWLVMGTVAAMTLTSTAGVMALAITGRRDTSGPMGKADRVLLLGVAALIAAFVDGPAPFVVAMVAVVFGCVATTLMRLGRFPKEAGDVR
jgi:CDP-diacylglycerol--glycerol-3-phosphate 3-phosphatidyltransferase